MPELDEARFIREAYDFTRSIPAQVKALGDLNAVKQYSAELIANIAATNGLSDEFIQAVNPNTLKGMFSAATAPVGEKKLVELAKLADRDGSASPIKPRANGQGFNPKPAPA